MELIDKSAIVAEIERLAKENNESGNVYDFGTEHALKSILSFINALEMKEVDFEKMWKEYFKYRGDIATVNVKHIAKHFFELGLVSQLTWQDIRLISEIGEEFMNSEESDSCTDEETYYSAILNKLKQLGRGYKTQRQEIRELNKTSKSI